MVPHMDIGEAVKALKDGKHVSREGWNGQGMWLAYQLGYPQGVAVNAQSALALGVTEGTVCRFRPYVTLCAADGSFVPWVASQSDLLAEDWFTHE
jgi:hypothetical protein